MWGPLVTAMVTPFDDALEVDYKAAADLAKHLADTGSSAVLVNGTTGESPTLTHAEKLDLVRAVQDALGGRVPVLAGTGSNDTRGTVELTQEATELGVDGIMLVCPYYNKPPQEGLFQHFAAAARATDRPVMIYNIEPRTARNIAPETIGRLAHEVPNIVALKEASGKIDQFAEMALVTPPGFHLYSGNDGDTPAMLCCGGVGVVSVASHVAGDAIQRMVAAYREGRLADGRDLYLRLFPLFKALFPPTSSSPAPVKEALRLMGHRVGGLRLPLVPVDDAVRDALTHALHALELL